MINLRQVAITTILVLSFILFILPALTDSIFIKIFVFISVLALLYQYSMDPSDSSTKIDRSLERIGNTPKTNNVNKELKENYDSLLELVFNMIISTNPDYKCATYMLSPNVDNLVLQKSTSNDFPDQIVKDNQLIVKIINIDNPSLIQQSEEKNAWIDLFGDKSWRGSECMMGIRLKYNNHVGGCLLLMVDHFKTVNDRDKNILSYL